LLFGCGAITFGPKKPAGSTSDADEARRDEIHDDRKSDAIGRLEAWERSHPADGSGDWAEAYARQWEAAWKAHVGVKGDWAASLRVRLADNAADNIEKALAKNDAVAARLTLGAASNELFGLVPTEKFAKSAAGVAQAYVERDRARLNATRSYAPEGDAGGCVFATEPFGPEGTANPGLSRVLRGKGTAYARCYTNTPIRSIAADELIFSAAAYRVEHGLRTKSLGVPSQAPERVTFMDVTIDLSDVPRSAVGQDGAVVALAAIDSKKKHGVRQNDRGELEPTYRVKGVTAGFFLWRAD
jgi:hypothetical protein